MSLRGTGMLITFMDIAPEDELEFNTWYDGEHLEERVRIPGFVAARRYVAPGLSPKYLATYEAKDLGVLGGPDYQKALSNQTDWSKQVMGRFVTPGRLIAGHVASVGSGRGGHILFGRVRPAAGKEAAVKAWAKDSWLPAVGKRLGVVAAHVMETDPILSLPLDKNGAPDRSKPAVPTTFVLLVEAARPDGLGLAIDAVAAKAAGAESVEAGTYALTWGLAKSELT